MGLCVCNILLTLIWINTHLSLVFGCKGFVVVVVVVFSPVNPLRYDTLVGLFV